MNDVVLILGAKSDIGIAIAHKIAKLGNSLQLAARNIKELEALRLELVNKYETKVTLHEFDALDVFNSSKFLDNLPDLPSIAISTVGLLGDQKESEKSIKKTIEEIRSNYEGPVAIFSELANRFENRGNGMLIGFSSVAGERGKATNYIYGSAKAGFTEFLSGLRNRLNNSGVHVMTILPGYITTKMTKNMNLPALLTGKTDELADYLLKAIKNKKEIVFFPPIWKIIMIILKIIPEKIFKKLKI